MGWLVVVRYLTDGISLGDIQCTGFGHFRRPPCGRDRYLHVHLDCVFGPLCLLLRGGTQPGSSTHHVGVHGHSGRRVRARKRSIVVLFSACRALAHSLSNCFFTSCPDRTTSSRRPWPPICRRIPVYAAATSPLGLSPVSSTAPAPSPPPSVCWRWVPSRKHMDGVRCGFTSSDAPPRVPCSWRPRYTPNSSHPRSRNWWFRKRPSGWVCWCRACSCVCKKCNQTGFQIS